MSSLTPLEMYILQLKSSIESFKSTKNKINSQYINKYRSNLRSQFCDVKLDLKV